MEFCTKVAGKMGTSLDGWDVKNLAILSLELAQNSVTCFLGSIHSTVIEANIKGQLNDQR